MAVAASATTLEVSGLSYRTGGATLLRGVSFAAGPGEFVGVVGPNGAGKSTLLRTIAGLLRPSEGRVAVGGFEPTRERAAVARQLAFIPQSLPDTHGFTALEIVLTGRNPHLGRLEFEGPRDVEIALRCMERTGTAQFANRDAATLSGGELQRVFVARALAQEPRVLILDEPTANLDVRHQFEVFAILAGLAKDGVNVVAAVHDLQLAARSCSRLLLMQDGQVVADGPPEEVLTAENIARAFGVRATVFQAPEAGELTVNYHGPIGPERDDG